MGRSSRRILGIAGSPGAGKTTYAARVVAEADVPAVHVPMDGFHLADSALVALGLRDRKGAPETFDAWGYAALLRRLRTATETVWAPAFERGLEQPLAAAISVGPEVELVVTYQPPAGGLGNIVASGIEGIVRGRIVAALDRMKEELER